MFIGMNINSEKESGITVDYEPGSIPPFCLWFTIGGTSVRLHLTSLELENLFFEVNSALQEFDRDETDRAIKKVLE